MGLPAPALLFGVSSRGGPISDAQGNLARVPWFALVALVGAWLGTLFLAKPIGDFSLMDDWSFAAAVKTLLDGGGFYPTGWTGMPLITQTFWGAAFCQVGGYSYTVLRLSSQVAAVGAVIGTAFLAREAGLAQRHAIAIAAVLGFNPIFYVLANTFMTDVLFTTLLVFEALFFLRALRSGSTSDLVVATLLACAATLCRQLGICAPLAYLVCSLLKQPFQWRHAAFSSLPACVCALALTALTKWLETTGRVPELYSFKADSLLLAATNIPAFALAAIKNLTIAILYLGWFLSPLIVWKVWAWRGRRFLSIFVPTALILVALLVASRAKWMPVGNNILIPSGVGPLLLHDTSYLGIQNVPPLPALCWQLITVISVFGGAAIVTWLFGFIWDNRTAFRRQRVFEADELAAIFLIGSVVIYLLPLMVAGFFDRYLVPILPLAGVAFMRIGTPEELANKGKPVFFLAVLVPLFAFSVFGTRDYFAWNRVRWLAIRDLESRAHLTPQQIDGGFEYNGSENYRPGFKPIDGHSWWWVEQDEYKITFGPIPQHRMISEYPYRFSLPPSDRTLFVLNKEKSVPSGPAHTEPR
jgi:hypothetical protein